jgi:hypothetical protein
METGGIGGNHALARYYAWLCVVPNKGNVERRLGGKGFTHTRMVTSPHPRTAAR